MSMAELKRLVTGMSVEEQNELAAFLLHLRLQNDPVWRTEMTRRIDSRDPKHWVALEDLKTGLSSGGKA